MSIITPGATLGFFGGSTPYQISRSLRFNSADSAYLSRTPASAGNRKTWTWAGWVKRSAFTLATGLFSTGSSATNISTIYFNADGTLWYYDYIGGVFTTLIKTSAVYRDLAAWQHIVVSVDTTQGSSSNRVKLYINGSQVTQFSAATYPSLNADTLFNTANVHYINREYSTSNYGDHYLADIHFIDGQALDPASFGEFSATTGVWTPKKYTGTYGTNGFHLPFSDNSTAAALGTDTSGNANTWTVNNISVAAGAGNDSLVDSPTNGTQTDTGVGGEVVGNYCTLNPLDNGGLTLANGNLDASRSTASWVTSRHTIGTSSGKWYWEITCTASTTGQGLMVGILNAAGSLATFVGNNSGGYGYNWDANKYNNGTGASYGATFTNGDVISVAFDADSGSITFYKNGTSQGVAYSSIPAGTYFPATSMTGTMSASVNHGQRPFAYTAPSGFKALCTQNLPTPTITKPSTVMDVRLYTGNGGTQTISGLGFSPDLVWIKTRSVGYYHVLYDTVRGTGTGKALYSNTTDAEGADSTLQNLTAFNSDGFSLGTTSGTNIINDSSQTRVAWTWDAGSSTVTNTDGTISSQVRANASAGFSIVTYPGGATNSTVGHGLGVTPEFIVCKSRNNATGWPVYHKSLGRTNYVSLNLTDASASYANYWGVVGPNATTFGVSDAGFGNNNGNMVAYCFAPVAGYSAFGSYTGNGSADGPFVYTGFRPRWIMIKRTTSDTGGGNWIVKDALRPTYNESNQNLFANLSIAETTEYPFDFLSNGFKIRVSQTDINGSSSQSYIYAAFAEAPFALARAR